MATFFFNGRGLSLRAKLISTNDRSFSNGGEKQMRSNFHEPVGGTPRVVCRVFRAKMSKTLAAYVQYYAE